MAKLALNDLRKTYRNNLAIADVSLDIADGEFVAFVGPSGCGKTTLLRMIAGLEDISGGDLLIDGRRVNDVGPAHRGVAMVFQSYALYPHMTVEQNMGFALKLAGIKPDERRLKIMEAARVLQLEPFLDRKPAQLSGGQKQRVAIGRAIVRNPGIFLFDEPLSSLDAALRGQMRIELSALHARLKATMIYVTHDQVEAMTMADKIVVLQAGRVEQVGSPLELYRNPRNLFVAGFIGSPPMNLLPVEAVAAGPDGVTVRSPAGFILTLPVATAQIRKGDRLTLGLRAEHLSLTPDGEAAGSVLVIERLGHLSLVHVRMPDGAVMVVQVQAMAAETLAVGDTANLSATAHGHLFGADGLALPALDGRARKTG